MSTLVSARLAFILGSLILLLWLAGVLWLIHQVVAGTTPDPYWRETVPDALVYLATGVVVATRRPAHPIGWLFIAGALISAVQLLFGEYAATTLALGPERLPYGPTAEWLSVLLQYTPSVLLFFMILLFPTGRLLSSRWRIVAWAGLCAASVGIASSALISGPLEPSSPFDNPFGVDAAILGQISAAASWLLIAAVLGALLSLMVRWHRSRGEERQQIKWFVAVAVVGISSLVSVSVVSALLPEGNSSRVLVDFLQNFLWLIVPASLPIVVAIAILKYRLYDIDFIINRTLVYGALTVCVVGLYVLVVGGLGALLRMQGNLLVSILAAGLVAVLFAPLRERLQKGVNRLMYGERDEPYAVLSRLGQRLETTLTPGAVLPTVVQTVKEALKLPYAAIELEQDGAFETATVIGEPVEDPLRLPLVYGGETVGRVVLGPRIGEETFTPADRRLLDDLAHQICVAVHAVRLTTDLQRSRERLVTAREEERRRLRRDLHDGVGPRLAALTLRIETARNRLAHDPAAEALLSDLAERAREAVADVRRSVHALRPPILDDLGLVPALRETAAQYGGTDLNVSVEAPEDLSPLSAAVEVAAYRIAQEAMANAVRHAGAGSCTVRLSLENSVLRLEIEDDGRGIGEDRGSGVGLFSMRERAEELGGRWVVGSFPAGGTRVRAELPFLEEPGGADV